MKIKHKHSRPHCDLDTNKKNLVECEDTEQFDQTVSFWNEEQMLLELNLAFIQNAMTK